MLCEVWRSTFQFQPFMDSPPYPWDAWVSVGKSLLMWVLIPNAWTHAELIEGSMRVLNVGRGENSVSAGSGLACLPRAVSHSECFTLLGDASRDLFGVSGG